MHCNSSLLCRLGTVPCSLQIWLLDLSHVTACQAASAPPAPAQPGNASVPAKACKQELDDVNLQLEQELDKLDDGEDAQPTGYSGREAGASPEALQLQAAPSMTSEALSLHAAPSVPTQVPSLHAPPSLTEALPELHHQATLEEDDTLFVPSPAQPSPDSMKPAPPREACPEASEASEAGSRPSKCMEPAGVQVVASDAESDDDFNPPPPVPSAAAIDQRVRRIMKKRADGTYAVPSEYVSQWSDIKNGGREKVLALFERVGWDPETWIHFNIG